MNKRAFCAALILSGFTACAPQKNVMVDFGDVEDYQDFLEERDENEAPEPFKPEPLYVSATGKVRAQPDIAVITATISAEDKNESRAVDEMSKIVNAVQDALSGREIETGFTGVSSRREFDQACLNANRAARLRHNQINGDYWFNRRLDQRGDTETKRRPARPRIAQNVCSAQTLKVATQMVIRIQPAEAAGDALRALSDAGAENAQLFGYDFTDYDALYQEAAEKAVAMARSKAETTARLAGATLGEIENFLVTAPVRTSRFGPQPNIIRPARPYKGQSGSVVDRQTNQRGRTPARMTTCWDGSKLPKNGSCPPEPVRQMSCWDGSVISNGGVCPSAPRPSFDDEIIVTSSKKSVTDRDMATAGFSQSEPQRVVTGKRVTRSRTTNALSMSLLSGPQTISVTADLFYSYETPLDGKIIMEGEE